MVRLVLFLLFAVWPLALPAQSLEDLAGRYRIDDRASRIVFSVAQVGGRPIEGRFRRFSGEFVLAGRDASRSSVTFTLAPESVETGDPRVDAFLKSEAVFDVARHPAVTFRSTSVQLTGPRSAVVTGRLTAKGITRTARFDIRFAGSEGRQLTFHVTGRLSRAMFAMDVGTPVYSNIVVLDMQLAGRRS